MEDITDEQIWGYIDGSISPKDKEGFERSLVIDTTVAARLAAFTALHKRVAAEISPDLLDPLAAKQMRFDVLAGLDLDTDVVRSLVVKKRDHVVTWVFIALLICFGGSLVVYFLRGSQIVPVLSLESELFVLPMAAVVLLAGLLLNGFLSYRRTIRG